MTVDPIAELRSVIDERWAVIQPRLFPNATDGWRLTPHGKVPPLETALTRGEAAHFLAALAPDRSGRPFVTIHDSNKLESDRNALIGSGRARGYLFFEKSGQRMGGLRLETIVQWAAMARLRDEFGWPRDQLICESPTLVRDGGDVLRYDALDIVLLKQRAVEPRARLLAEAICVGAETKATPAMLNTLVMSMRACTGEDATSDRHEHSKCKALNETNTRLFLAVAAQETWRLFTVVAHGGRRVLGDELTPDLRELEYARFRNSFGGAEPAR